MASEDFNACVKNLQTIAFINTKTFERTIILSNQSEERTL